MKWAGMIRNGKGLGRKEWNGIVRSRMGLDGKEWNGDWVERNWTGL